MPRFGPDDLAPAFPIDRRPSDPTAVPRRRAAASRDGGAAGTAAAARCEVLEARTFLSASPAPLRAIPMGLASGPTANITTLPANQGTIYTFSLTYRDISGIDRGSIGSTDVRVTGTGYDQLGTLVGLPILNEDQSVTANYQVPAPTTAGRYLIGMEPNQVLDTTGAAVTIGVPPGTPLGSFEVGGSGGGGGGGGIDLPPSQKPDLAVTLIGAPISAVAGTRGSLRVRVENRGDEPIRGRTRLALYASADESVGALDTQIVSVEQRPFKVGQVRTAKLNFDWPQLNGNFFLLARADDSEGVTEQFEFNNVGSSETPVTISPPFVDVVALIPGDASNPAGDDQPLATNALIGGRQDVKVRVTNRGNVALPRQSGVALFLSSDGTLDASDIALRASGGAVGRLGANAATELDMRFDVPATITPGSYFVVAKADAGGVGGSGVLTEPDEANNLAASPYPITFTRPFVDLVGTFINVASGGATAFVPSPGNNRIVVDVQNNGNVAASGPLAVTVYAAATQQVATSNVVLARPVRNVTIEPGETERLTIDFRLPPTLTTGSFFLRGSVDSSNRFVESNETNNEVFSSFPFQIL